jgi:uncharacterized peroxidase-related enzyme
MSWVPIVSPEQAAPEVRQVYDEIQRKWSFVPNYYYALGRDRQLLLDQFNLFTNAMFVERPGGLSRILKEQIALVVSGINLSSYCLAAHMEILGRLGFDRPTARKLSVDFENAPVEPRVMELFRVAVKLTRQPGEMAQSDIDRLHQNGWNDDEVFDMVLVASLYACANRFSAGLGLLPDF